MKHWLVPKQMAIGKNRSNPLMAVSFPKTIALYEFIEPKRIERIGELKKQPERCVKNRHSGKGRIDEDPNTYFAQDDEVVHDQDTAEEGQPEDSSLTGYYRPRIKAYIRFTLHPGPSIQATRRPSPQGGRPMDLEIEKEKKKPTEFQEIEEEQIEKDISKKTTGKRKKHLPRRGIRSTAKKQKVEQDDKKEELKKLFRYSSKRRSYSRYFCGDYTFPANAKWNWGHSIWLTEKKYPLSQEMLSKMLSKGGVEKGWVDQESTQAYELLKFTRSQVKK
ncbi:hypothetical protein Tco_0509682 [Tanacetum coccineum]